MSEEPSAENAGDAVASALGDLATAVTGLDDWHQIRDWALKGGAVNKIPPQLSGLDSYRAVSAALSADERLSALVSEESPQRPVVRVGLIGMQLRASTMPAGMIASAIERCCLRHPYRGQPTPAVLRDVLAENLNALRRIAAGKTVTLPCLAGARGVRLRPGQASLETVLGTLHAEDVHVARADLDHEEPVQAPEGHRAVDVEEVGSEHRRGLRVQELPPRGVGVPLGRRGDLQRFEDPADCGCADPVADLEQLALHPLVPPSLRLSGEPLDERGNLATDPRAARPGRIGPPAGCPAARPPQDRPRAAPPRRPRP